MKYTHCQVIHQLALIGDQLGGDAHYGKDNMTSKLAKVITLIYTFRNFFIWISSCRELSSELIDMDYL